MVDRFIWTEHAESRAAERGLVRFDVETVIREGHDSREVNRGPGDWRVRGSGGDEREFVVVYDYPVFADEEMARIVTIWRLRNPRRRQMESGNGGYPWSS
jgi:hypothetical protein